MDIEQEAGAMGWVAQEHFKGDESKWVDAETFVARGKEIMPILRKNNERLLGEVSGLKSTVENLTQAVAQSNESMAALKEFHETSSKAQVEKVRREILAQLKDAKTEGDVDAEVKATADLSEFDAAQKAAKQTPAPRQQQAVPPALHPEVKTWMEENPWYGKDHERTGLMDGISKKLRTEGSTKIGREFLLEAAEIVEQRLGGGDRRGSKVDDGGGNGGARSGGGGSGGSGTGYSSLPKEARDQCDKQAERFVGEHKAYKSLKEWQTFYASEYNKGN